MLIKIRYPNTVAVAVMIIFPKLEEISVTLISLLNGVKAKMTDLSLLERSKRERSTRRR